MARVMEATVGQLKALAHPVRLRMVDLLRSAGGELCACAFEPHFDLTQPTISHHLKVLREAGLLRSRQEGSWVHHALEPKAFVALGQVMNTFATGADHDPLSSETGGAGPGDGCASLDLVMETRR
jgi:ArsR family transcriptional regulator